MIFGKSTDPQFDVVDVAVWPFRAAAVAASEVIAAKLVVGLEPQRNAPRFIFKVPAEIATSLEIDRDRSIPAAGPNRKFRQIVDDVHVQCVAGITGGGAADQPAPPSATV